MAYLLGFNNNIRCIEIVVQQSGTNTTTAFNNNIRCIEITPISVNQVVQQSFNNNIRCIEILGFWGNLFKAFGLITT